MRTTLAFSGWKNGRNNMLMIPMSHGLLLAAILFALGMTGLLVRRNLIFILMSVEIMLNAAAWPLSWPAHGGRSRTAKLCSFSSWQWLQPKCPSDWRCYCSCTARGSLSMRTPRAK